MACQIGDMHVNRLHVLVLLIEPGSHHSAGFLELIRAHDVQPKYREGHRVAQDERHQDEETCPVSVPVSALPVDHDFGGVAEEGAGAGPTIAVAWAMRSAAVACFLWIFWNKAMMPSCAIGSSVSKACKATGMIAAATRVPPTRAVGCLPRHESVPRAPHSEIPAPLLRRLEVWLSASL